MASSVFSTYDDDDDPYVTQLGCFVPRALSRLGSERDPFGKTQVASSASGAEKRQAGIQGRHVSSMGSNSSKPHEPVYHRFRRAIIKSFQCDWTHELFVPEAKVILILESQ